MAALTALVAGASPEFPFSLADLRDKETMDLLFIFICPETNHTVGVWAHQAALTLTPGRFAEVYPIGTALDMGSSGSRLFEIVQVIRKKGSTISRSQLICSITSLCAMLRYIYTKSELSGHVDMRDFTFSAVDIPTPGQPPVQLDQVVFDHTLPNELQTTPIKYPLWSDLQGLAKFFGMKDLVQQCGNRQINPC